MSQETAPASSGTSTSPDQALARGSLRTIDAIAISISVLSPAMAMQLNTGGVAATAGGSTPLAFLLGGIACLTLGFVVIGFTRRMAAAGYAYTYVSRSLGKQGGFVAGWLYFFGFACFVPMTMAGVGWLFADLLGISHNYWFLFFLVGMGLLIVLSVVRISVTTKVQLLVGAATVIVILGVTSYIGFESAADFGEETAHPRRAVPIAVTAAVIFAILFYVFITYTTTIGYGVNELAKNPLPWVNNGVAGVASKFGNEALAKLVEIGAMLSAFIVCVACATAGARTLFAMGREGVLPGWFARTHPRYKTPVNATLTIAAVATGAAALVGYGFGTAVLGGDAFTVYYFFATLGTLAVILVYIALCLGGIAFFKKTSRRFNPLLHGLIPLIGAVIFGAAWYGSIYPVPTNILKVTPYITAAWLIIGIGVVVWLKAKRPRSVERIGSILGEEGGTLVEALDTP
jgi:amino acid transporter